MVPMRESSGLRTRKRVSTPEPVPKRRRIEPFDILEAGSDEEADIATTADDIQLPQHQVVSNEGHKSKETMSEGVAAALAQLRENT